MNRTDIPSPLYAAAGAGEFAYQKLLQLPEAAARTWQRVAERSRDTDWEQVRDTAQRGTAAFVAKASVAQERAATGYRKLVLRGERVMADRLGVATGQAEPTKIEVEVGPVQAADRPGAEDTSAAKLA